MRGRMCVVLICNVCVRVGVAGRVFRDQSRVRVRDDERRDAESSDPAACCRPGGPRDGVRWRSRVPASARRDPAGLRRGRCDDGT